MTSLKIKGGGLLWCWYDSDQSLGNFFQVVTENFPSLGFFIWEVGIIVSPPTWIAIVQGLCDL